MVNLATYDDAVVYTLRTRAVRSAILIDDSFPTFHDLLENHFHEDVLTRKYPDWKTARNLYAFLHGSQIVCDIENNVADISNESIEKIRKSDLVVLDWNLSRGDDSDSEGAVRVLKGLSESSHFNLVVVYTRTPKLASAWTRAALRLRGGWQRYEHFLGSLDTEVDAEDLFRILDEEEMMEQVTDDLLAHYVVGGWRSLLPIDTGPLMSLMEEFQVEQQHRKSFAEAFIHRVAMKRHNLKPGNGTERRLDGDASRECPYFACGSVFVAFMNKPRQEEAGAPTIFDCLDSALKAWHPNLLQLLVSELQNELERNSYAFDGALFPDESLKAQCHQIRRRKSIY